MLTPALRSLQPIADFMFATMSWLSSAPANDARGSAHGSAMALGRGRCRQGGSCACSSAWIAATDAGLPLLVSPVATAYDWRRLSCRTVY